MSKLLNNPLYLVGIILATVVFICAIVCVIMAIKKYNLPENVEKRKKLEMAKAQKLENEKMKNNIDVPTVSSKIYVKDAVKVDVKKPNVDEIISLSSTSAKKTKEKK